MASDILVNISSGNGVLHVQSQAINWTRTNVDLLLIGLPSTNFIDIRM